MCGTPQRSRIPHRSRQPGQRPPAVAGEAEDASHQPPRGHCRKEDEDGGEDGKQPAGPALHGDVVPRRTGTSASASSAARTLAGQAALGSGPAARGHDAGLRTEGCSAT